MKKIIFLLMIVMFLFLNIMADENEVLKKARVLIKAKKYTQALNTIDLGINKGGLTFSLARLKFVTLKNLNRLDKADGFMDDALKNPSFKRYYRSIAFAKCDLNVSRKKYGPALKDLGKMADSGFNDYGFFNQDKFKLLREQKGFNALVAKMKKNGGVGKPARDFTVTIHKGNKFTLSRYKGRVVLVDFWSTHCPPCLKELPQMKKYYQEFHPQGLEIIGISLDHEKGRLDKFLKDLKLPWGISFDKAGWGRKTVINYKIFSIPSYWLVDKKGILRYFGLRKEELKRAIKELIEEK